MPSGKGMHRLWLVLLDIAVVWTVGSCTSTKRCRRQCDRCYDNNDKATRDGIDFLISKLDNCVAHFFSYACWKLKFSHIHCSGDLPNGIGK